MIIADKDIFLFFKRLPIYYAKQTCSHRSCSNLVFDLKIFFFIRLHGANESNHFAHEDAVLLFNSSDNYGDYLNCKQHTATVYNTINSVM